jgi:hypothetical protein
VPPTAIIGRVSSLWHCLDCLEQARSKVWVIHILSDMDQLFPGHHRHVAVLDDAMTLPVNLSMWLLTGGETGD